MADERKEDIYNQSHIDRKRNSSEWLGAILRYFSFLGKRKFDEIYIEKELKKNVKIGSVFKITLILAILFICYLILF